MIIAITETLPAWPKNEHNGVRWKVALVCPSCDKKEAGREEYSAVVMSCILSKRKDHSKWRTKSHGELLSDSRTKPKSRNWEYVLVWIPEYNGAGTVIYLPFFFCFYSFSFPCYTSKQIDLCLSHHYIFIV